MGPESNLETEKINSKMVGNKASVTTKNRAKRLLLIAILLGVIGVIVLGAYLGGFFNLEKVEVGRVDGTKLVNVSGSAIEISILDKFEERKLPFLSISEVTKLVDKSSPYIRYSSVEKIFPDTLKVQITERIPFIIVESAGKCSILDPEGVVVEQYIVGSEDTSVSDCNALNETKSLPILTSDDVKAEFKLSEKSSFYDIEKILLVVRALESRDYEVNSIRLELGVYTLGLEGDRQVVFSNKQDTEIQVKRLLLVLEQLDIDDLEFKTLDIRYERPVLTK